MSAADDKLDVPPPGPLRRNWPLLLGVLAVLLVGPSLSRLIESYRAVVLDVEGDSLLLAWERKPPEWATGIDAQSGDIVAKEPWSWSPQVVPAEPYDRPLLDLHRRYNRTYTGVITAIAEPKSPGGAHTATIEVDGGGVVHVALYAEHLATAAVGRRVEKNAGAWDPVLVDELPPAAPSGSNREGARGAAAPQDDTPAP